jgi:hypothetical protein
MAIIGTFVMVVMGLILLLAYRSLMVIGLAVGVIGMTLLVSVFSLAAVVALVTFFVGVDFFGESHFGLIVGLSILVGISVVGMALKAAKREVVTKVRKWSAPLSKQRPYMSRWLP